MASYTISQITLPNGDICYLKDANPVTELPSVTGANDGNVLIVENGEWTTGEVHVPETASDLPDVTTSDYGLVLMVGANGEWGAAEPQKKLGDGVAGRLYISGNTVDSVSRQLEAIPTDYVGTFKSDASSTSLLTGGKVSAIVAGTVANLTGRIYEFFGRQANTENVYFWRITFNDKHTSITVGTVYKLTGTAV